MDVDVVCVSFGTSLARLRRRLAALPTVGAVPLVFKALARNDLVPVPAVLATTTTTAVLLAPVPPVLAVLLLPTVPKNAPIPPV